MSAHDDLARQLRESVRARRRRRRLRASRGAFLAAAGAIVIGGGAATAATGVLPGVAHRDDHPLNAREVAFRAVQETRDDPACRAWSPRAGATTAPVAPAPAARRLLTGTPSAAAQRFAETINHGGPIVAESARRVLFPGAGAVSLWLAAGTGSGSVVDPVACGRARLAQLARDRPDPRSRLRQKAAAVLATYSDTKPGVQTLWLMYERTGARSAGGTGIPLDGRSLPTGLLAGGGGQYVGIAVARATRVTADGRDGLHRAVRVRGGLFLLTVPPQGTGRIRLRQRAADGRVLAAQTLRG